MQDRYNVWLQSRKGCMSTQIHGQIRFRNYRTHIYYCWANIYIPANSSWVAIIILLVHHILHIKRDVIHIMSTPLQRPGTLISTSDWVFQFSTILEQELVRSRTVIYQYSLSSFCATLSSNNHYTNILTLLA